MKAINYLLTILLLAPAVGFAQSDEHYTMFMYNKMLYNPAYTGSRDLMSANATYRNQWTGINGAPKLYNISVDGPVGSYMKSFRSVATGISIDNEQIGVENNTNVMAYYAYRIRFEKTVLSLGLRAGAKLYSANYSQLNPYQPFDKNLTHDIKNAFLPNFGSGVYWSGDKFYLGLSVPNMLQPYYDKNETINTLNAREIRGYYLSGGYVLPLNDIIKIEPQAIVRYIGNATYNLPLNCDINLSAIVYDRILFGFTYRTDNSYEAIVHLQVTNNINIGYAYDHITSALGAYSSGSHEIVVGYDFIREHYKYTTPRFVKSF